MLSSLANRLCLTASLILALAFSAGSQQSIPFVLSHQGRIALNSGENFDGTGFFKFSLLTDDRPPLWRNDGSTAENGIPLSAVQLPVTKGLYSVLLGDTQLNGMTEIPPPVFTHPRVYLRIWFSADGQNFELLQPDQRIAAVGYAMVAQDVPDGTITSDKLAPGAVQGAQLAPGSVQLEKLSPDLRASIEALLAWQAEQVPLITSPTAVQASTDLPFSYQISAGGSPTSFNATGLPGELSFESNSGLVTGILSSSADFTFDVTATNLAGPSAPVTVSVDVFGPIYVDATIGNDAGLGTTSFPLRTIQAGIDRAAGLSPIRSVRVSTATQTVDEAVVLADGVSVLGGFNRRALWSPGGRTPLERRNPGPTETTVSVVNAHDLSSATRIDGFNITAPHAVAHKGSSVAVWCLNAADVVLSNNTLTAGNGSSGNDGTDGGAPTNGANGQNGGVVGGYPYAGGGCVVALSDTVSCSDPGDGGIGGFTLLSFTGPRKQEPTDGKGPGGSAGANGVSPTPGSNGSHGQDGPDGAIGAVATGIGSFPLGYLPAGGGAGQAGVPGETGGGGGGGGARLAEFTLALVAEGGGGGQGGGGGSGGAHGTGGTGGGGSFGVIAANSTVAVTDCTITLGSGGIGGEGGNGNFGGTGGFRGLGFFPTTGAAAGGNGGAGGDGGAGGPGAGGAGGPTIGILLRNDSTLSANTNNTFNLGTPGTGGPGGVQGAFPNRREAPDGPLGLAADVFGSVSP